MILEQFQEKITEYLIFIDVEKNLSEHTQKAYKIDLEQFSNYWKEVNQKSKVPFSIQDALGKFLVFMYHNKIDKSSIARKISCFKSFERYISHFGIKINLNLMRPKLDKKLPIYLTIDEVFTLLDNIKDEDLRSSSPYRDKAIFELLYATGIRCSELVNIKLCDLDMQNKLIRVMGKGKKERIVLFGEKAKEKINSYIKQERPNSSTNNEQKLFLNYQEQTLTTRSIQRIIANFRKFLKIERKITPHKLRHSFATHMLNQGVDLRVVQELLGHQTLSSTEKYTHVSTTELAQLCDNLHPFNSMFKKNKDLD